MYSVGFDLDMTLVDSSEAIVQTTLNVLKNFSAEVDHDEIYRSVGLPIKESFKKFLENHAAKYKDLVENTSNYQQLKDIFLKDTNLLKAINFL